MLVLVYSVEVLSPEQDRSRHQPLGPPGKAGVEHWDGAVRCVSVDPVLSGCVIYMGGVQYAPRWL